jgi:O-acetyl-ADP-ribose deacetylase (regulator of RNase III)
MLQQIEGDVLNSPDLTHIVHQCNLYCNFGAGIAADIKRKFPDAYRADCGTVKGDVTKLGTFTTAEVKPGLWVVNLYSQVGISATERVTSYDAMAKGLALLEGQLRVVAEKDIVKVGFPYKIGCGLGGGNWAIVEAILRSAFGAHSPIQAVIVKRPWD